MSPDPLTPTTSADRQGEPPAPSFLQRRARIAVNRGTALRYLAGMIALMAIGIGIVAHLVDDKDFPTIGVGIWWAIVTLGTVGYGDVVPTTTPGKILGAAVIVFGVTFISFLTAIVTSYFVSQQQKEESAPDRERTLAAIEALERIERRLETMEGAIRSPEAPPRETPQP